jgi:NADH:ubiquinone oxidoreductase subunit 6 (subunit J)
MSSFAIYLIGFLLFIAGLAYGAFLLGIALTWIFVGALTLLGFGMVIGVGKTRQKDQTPTSE